MSWSCDRPVYGTVSQAAPITGAASARKSLREMRRSGMGGILPDGHVPQGDHGSHGRFGPRPTYLELHPHRYDLPAVGGRKTLAVEIGEREATDALGEGLGAAARVASQRGLARPQEVADPLARRIDHPVAVQVPLEDDPGRLGHEHDLEARPRRIKARLLQLTRHALEGRARGLLRLDPARAPAPGGKPRLQQKRRRGHDEAEEPEGHEE